MPERSTSIASPVIRAGVRCVGEVAIMVASPLALITAFVLQDEPICSVPSIGGNSLSAIPSPDERASVLASTGATRPVLVLCREVA